MKLAIMQPYFFPHIDYWQLIHAADRFVLFDDAQYMRHGWVNRNRVLKPGGRLVILESSKPENRFWRVFNNIYLRFILPYLGGLFSGNFKAYRYLARSSRNYYSLNEMGLILEGAGFKVLSGRPLFLGSVMLLVASK